MPQICPWLKKGECRFGTRCRNPHGKVDFPCPFLNDPKKSCKFPSEKCWFDHSHESHQIPPKAQLQDFICAEIEKEKFSNQELIHESKELKKENTFLKSKLKELEKEINQNREVILNCQQEHEKRVAENFQAEKEAFNSRFSDILLFLDNFAKTYEQRIVESKRAVPAETEAAIKEVEKDEHNDHEVREEPKATVIELKRSGEHEVRVIADDLNFIDWEHPFVQWATQQMFPMNTPEQLKEKRHSVGKNFVTFMLETMANFLTGEIKIFDRPVGERW